MYIDICMMHSTKVSVHILHTMIYVHVTYYITSALHVWSKMGTCRTIDRAPAELELICSFNGEAVTRFESVLTRDQAILSNPSYFSLHDSYEAATFPTRTRCKSTTVVMYTVTFSGRGVIQFVSNDMLQHVCGSYWRFYSDLHFPEFRDDEGNILYRVAQPWFPQSLFAGPIDSTTMCIIEVEWHPSCSWWQEWIIIYTYIFIHSFIN